MTHHTHILLPIVMSEGGTRCSPDCRFIDIGWNTCRGADADLVLDVERGDGSFIRLDACIAAERAAQEADSGGGARGPDEAESHAIADTPHLSCVQCLLTEDDAFCPKHTQAHDAALNAAIATIARLREQLACAERKSRNRKVEIDKLNRELRTIREYAKLGAFAHAHHDLAMQADGCAKMLGCARHHVETALRDYMAGVRLERLGMPTEDEVARLREREARVRALCLHARDTDVYDTPRLELPLDVLSVLNDEKDGEG